MNNITAYEDRIVCFDSSKSACEDFIEPIILGSYGRTCEDTRCKRCELIQTLWAMQEYQEPEQPDVDWTKVPVDTPIYVRNSENDHWLKRHFAEYKNEEVHTWNNGRTSFTTHGLRTAWKYARLAEDNNANTSEPV